MCMAGFDMVLTNMPKTFGINGGKGKMKRIKLTVAYDGTNYHGWQIQPNAVTVESELNKVISELTGNI